MRLDATLFVGPIPVRRRPAAQTVPAEIGSVSVCVAALQAVEAGGEVEHRVNSFCCRDPWGTTKAQYDHAVRIGARLEILDGAEVRLRAADWSAFRGDG